MKSNNRKIFITPSLNEIMKDRLAHIDNGIAGDILIPEEASFASSYNRDTVKKVNRFALFLRSAEAADIAKYFSEKKEIEDLSSLYANLKSYTPEDSFFTLVFYESKGLLRETEYKLLYLLKKGEKPLQKDYKKDIAECIEWKKEYIPTEKQRQIANFKDNNVVLGAAGTGKTDVAVHSYINAMDADKLKTAGLKDDVFITYSEKLADYVDYITDIFWDDYKNPIRKNVYTTKDFFLRILAENTIELKGYTLKDSKYYNGKELLNDKIASKKEFDNWMSTGFTHMNKANIPALLAIIKKYGDDYPYLFYRGVFKGKIINKVSDTEVSDYFMEKLSITEKDFESIKGLFDNFAEETDDLTSESEFHSWYNLAVRRYQIEFKKVPSRYREEKEFFELYLTYFDFVNPIREEKRYIDYYPLFKREALLIEGYRGTTRKDFDEEIKVLYEMCRAYSDYMEENHLYDDNDLAYFITLHREEILSSGIFKNIIVDEFQDMTERQIHTIVKLTRNEEENGVIHIFGDFEQTINPTFLQMENIETIYMVNGIEDYATQILSSSFRYSAAICRELEALRELGKKLFGTEDIKGYLPLVSNAEKEFETGGNLLINMTIGKEMLSKITKAKNVTNIMYIVSDNKAKEEFINEYKCDKEKVFTISESKGREEDFVIVYKVCTDKNAEYENLFGEDMTYSRAGRIFYNRLYVGITRCKVNFLQIEDETVLGKKTLENLKKVIAPLKEENTGLFLEELLSQKANFYFRARDSFRNLDFKAVLENLSFYNGEDFDSLALTTRLVFHQMEGKDETVKLGEMANSYKKKDRTDLARVIYMVLDNNEMLRMLDLRENKNLDMKDTEIRSIILNNKSFLDNEDIRAVEETGYYERKKKNLLNKIASLHQEVK